MFFDGLSHLCNLKSELALAQSVKRTKRCILRLNTAFMQIQVTSCHLHKFDSRLQNAEKDVLLWNIAFVEFKVIVDSCRNRVFQFKALKKTFFAMDYRICAI